MDTATADADAKVQRVTKKSSDELLRKFAELGSEETTRKKHLSLTISLKKPRGFRRDDHCDSPSGSAAALVERRSLLPPGVNRRTALLRPLRARDIRNRSLLGTIQKTWRTTVQGASRVFIEKHYHRHKRLINDIV
ncbi:hypothetical protein HN51_015297 [Arachis hypogaea]|uniref:Uncharacterized protein LOC107492894 n=1 Tax=Arachis duranensis TaxID=130453 RepID=A0A6P4DJR9_ARADU|nr:uncharacterized protein LOC107492894 [Arachis duranensis]XP_025604506.1 uncharacterized protein LOC112696117 [Arachis hypogaea]QHO44656.1 uncharacterized protein DS421_6g172610 [Arachis hypogaea]